MQSERSFLRWLTAVLFVILAFASAASAQAPDLADASDLTPPINVADVPSAQTQDATPSAPTSENPTEAASEFPASPIAAPATLSQRASSVGNPSVPAALATCLPRAFTNPASLTADVPTGFSAGNLRSAFTNPALSDVALGPAAASPSAARSK